MTKKLQKPTVFSDFIEKLRAENSENVMKSSENFKMIIGKLSLLGAFSMIKTFSENAEKVITSSPYTPISLLKLYMNAIVNVCVVLEKAISEAEKEQKDQIQQAGLEVDKAPENGSFEDDDYSSEYGSEAVKVADTADDDDEIINDEKIFADRLSKFKKDKN